MKKIFLRLCFKKLSEKRDSKKQLFRLIFESNYRLTVKSLLHQTGKAVS